MAIPAAPSTPPVIFGERVFISTLPGLISAHDLKNGQEVWRASLGPDQPIVVNGERLYVAANETVQALQASDRAVAWRAPTGKLTAPLIVKDGWVIATSATGMVALRESDGTVVWQRAPTPQRERGAIDGNTLFVPLANGRLQAVNLADGATLWERRFAGSPAEPLVVGDRVYVGASDKQFYCVKTSSGDVDWKMRVGAEIRGRAATDGERVFFVALDNLVRAVDRGSGAQRWQKGVPFRPFAGPSVSGTSVFIAGPTTDVRMFRARDGSEAGTIPFPEALVVAPAVGSAAATEVVVAGVTGGLNEAWKLWLASPVPPKQ